MREGDRKIGKEKKTETTRGGVTKLLKVYL